MKRYKEIATRHRNVIFLVLAFVLMVANVLNWGAWGQASSREVPGREPMAEGFRASDFLIKDLNGPAEQGVMVSRDLFYPVFEEDSEPVREITSIAADNKNIKQITNADMPPSIPQQTPEQLEEEMAQSDAANFKYIGSIWRAGKAQALLVNMDKRYFVFSGEKAGNRFVVERITNDSVSLRDPITNVTAQILISGGPALKAVQETSDTER